MLSPRCTNPRLRQLTCTRSAQKHTTKSVRPFKPPAHKAGGGRINRIGPDRRRSRYDLRRITGRNTAPIRLQPQRSSSGRNSIIYGLL